MGVNGDASEGTREMPKNVDTSHASLWFPPQEQIRTHRFMRTLRLWHRAEDVLDPVEMVDGLENAQRDINSADEKEGLSG